MNRDLDIARQPSSDASDSQSLVPTTAPQGTSMVRSRKRWMKGSATVGVLALSLGLAACGGGSDSPTAATPPAATPPAATPPAATPPAATPPAATVPTGFKAVAPSPTSVAGSTLYYKDGNGNNILDAGERTIIFNSTNQHYYELVTGTTAIAFTAAKTSAEMRGGHLFAAANAAEIKFVQDIYSFPAAGSPPTYGGIAVNNSDPNAGAWVGLTLTAPGTWTWFTSAGATTGGDALAITSPYWIVRSATDKEPTGETLGAMTGGNPLTTAPSAATQVLYDTDANATIAKYIVEYETLASIKNADGTPLVP